MVYGSLVCLSEEIFWDALFDVLSNICLIYCAYMKKLTMRVCWEQNIRIKEMVSILKCIFFCLILQKNSVPYIAIKLVSLCIICVIVFFLYFTRKIKNISKIDYPIKGRNQLTVFVRFKSIRDLKKGQKKVEKKGKFNITQHMSKQTYVLCRELSPFKHQVSLYRLTYWKFI